MPHSLSQIKTLLARVAEKLGVDLEVLQGYFAEARTEMRDEAIQKLIDEGRITQEEVDQYQEWLEAKPDMEPFREQLREWGQNRPEIPSELKEWLEDKPDTQFGFGGRRALRGIGGIRGFCGPSAQAE